MGARGDFEQATRLATEMVRVGGLSRAIGPRSLHSDVPLSEETKRLMDGEIDSMLRSALDVARHALYKNRKLFDAVRSMLLEKETLTAEDFQTLVRREGVCAVKP
uniref:Peptidase M41 domain-containing protein n=1 Tax=Noctiluca scintillans TaxID=2966 RepID=A0A7S1FCE3_NOCSC